MKKVIFLFAFCLLLQTSFTQERNVVDPALFPALNSFQNLNYHDFIPASNSVFAYKYDGSKIKISPNDTFTVDFVYFGVYNNIKGYWIGFKKDGNVDYYLPLNLSNLIDVSYIKWNKRKREDFISATFHLIALGLLSLPFLFIALYVKYKEKQLGKKKALAI